MSVTLHGGWVERIILLACWLYWRFNDTKLPIEFHIVPAKQGHTYPNNKVISIMFCHIFHGWKKKHYSPSVISFHFIFWYYGIKLTPHSLRIDPLSRPLLRNTLMRQNPQQDSLSLLLILTKARFFSPNWKDSKYIIDARKKEFHFAKYDKFLKCFMASTQCAGSWGIQTGLFVDSCGEKGWILT